MVLHASSDSPVNLLILPSPFSHTWPPRPPAYRRMVLLRLQNIGRGLWARDGKCKRLMGCPPTLGE